jgi:hypothetical protein
MKTVDYNCLLGGIDSRTNFEDLKENPKILFWNDAVNVEIYNGMIRRQKGQRNIMKDTYISLSEVQYDNIAIGDNDSVYIAYTLLNGDIIVFGVKYVDGVYNNCIWRSTDDGATFDTGAIIRATNDTSNTIYTFNTIIERLTGTLLLFDRLNTACYESNDNGQTFTLQNITVQSEAINAITYYADGSTTTKYITGVFQVEGADWLIVEFSDGYTIMSVAEYTAAVTTTPITNGFEAFYDNNRYFFFTNSGFNLFDFGSGLQTLKKINEDVRYIRTTVGRGYWVRLKTLKNINEEAPVNFAQMNADICVCNGFDEAFLYNLQTKVIRSTNLFAQRKVKGRIACAYQSRMWIADGTALYYSDLNTPDEFRDDPDNLHYGGVIDTFRGNTDDITALKPYGQYLAIYTKQHIYILSGTEPTTFQIALFGTMGVDSPNAVCNYANKQYFLSSQDYQIHYIGQFGDLGQMMVSPEPLTVRVSNMLKETISVGALKRAFLVPCANKNQLWLYTPEIGQDNLTTAYIFDFNYPECGIPITKRCGKELSAVWAFGGDIYSGSPDGNIYQENQGDTFDGESIAFLWYSSFIDFGKRTQLKRCEFVKLWFSLLYANTCKLVIRFNQHITKQKTKRISVKNKNAMYNIAQYGVDKYATDDQNSVQAVLGKEFNSVQVGITGDSGDDFSLRSLTFVDPAVLSDV